MSDDPRKWPARKRVKHSLLKRAFEQNRGAEVILMIQWRTAQESHKNEGFAKLARKFLIDEGNACQPRSIRALNLIAQEKGLNQVYRDAATEPPKADIIAYLRNIKKDDQILLPEKPAPAPTYFGTPDQFGIRAMSEDEKMLRRSRRPVEGQRDVRMEELPDRVSSDQGLSLLSAVKMPKGYLPN